MANVAQSWATGPLFFLKAGCPNQILVASGNRATANFEHCENLAQFYCMICVNIIVCSLGARSFSAAAPKLWNDLPLGLRQATSLDSFKVIPQK